MVGFQIFNQMEGEMDGQGGFTVQVAFAYSFSVHILTTSLFRTQPVFRFISNHHYVSVPLIWIEDILRFS